MAYNPIIPIPDSCKGNQAYGSLVPGWIVSRFLDGSPPVVDTKTKACAEAVVRHVKSKAPKEILYRGLPENFVMLSKEWDDPERRSALLARMAQSTPLQLKAYFSSHMDEEWNIKLWLARFKAYIDAIESMTLDNVIPEPDTGSTADIFYSEF